MCVDVSLIGIENKSIVACNLNPDNIKTVDRKNK